MATRDFPQLPAAGAHRRRRGLRPPGRRPATRWASSATTPTSWARPCRRWPTRRQARGRGRGGQGRRRRRGHAAPGRQRCAARPTTPWPRTIAVGQPARRQLHQDLAGPLHRQPGQPGQAGQALDATLRRLQGDAHALRRRQRGPLAATSPCSGRLHGPGHRQRAGRHRRQRQARLAAGLQNGQDLLDQTAAGASADAAGGQRITSAGAQLTNTSPSTGPRKPSTCRPALRRRPEPPRRLHAGRDDPAAEDHGQGARDLDPRDRPAALRRGLAQDVRAQVMDKWKAGDPGFKDLSGKEMEQLQTKLEASPTAPAPTTTRPRPRRRRTRAARSRPSPGAAIRTSTRR
jgi:hypothetical protein